ncbi:MAG: AI-2E family transporter [Deltaproteobacteria bacterium]|nr:AI-2E family transporter [Deltaproteobacteria bacterium]
MSGTDRVDTDEAEAPAPQGRTIREQAESIASDRPFVSRGLIVLVVLVVLGLLVYELRGVLTPIFTALGIAYLLDPLVDRFEARGVPRGIGITIVLTALALVVTLFSLLVLPGVIHEVAVFLSDLPNELLELVRRAEPVLQEYGVPVPHSVNEALEQFELDPATIASHAAQPVEAVLRGVLGGTASAIGVLASALIVPVLAFYLLYDFDHMVAGARDLVPVRIRPQVVEIATEIDQMLGQFVRGQLLVMIAMAILYGIAYSIVGVRLAIPIALLAGLLAFIPYVGSGSALTMGLLMCIVDWDGWLKPVLVIVAYAICQFLEGFVIMPRVVGDKVGLPAVWVLVALMMGGEVFGFLGVLLAVPTAAVVKIFVVRGLAWYKKSRYYLGEEAEHTQVGEAIVAAAGADIAPGAAGPASEPTPSGATEAEIAAATAAVEAKIELAAASAAPKAAPVVVLNETATLPSDSKTPPREDDDA